METTYSDKKPINLGQFHPDELGSEEVTIVLPVLNEERAIGPVIQELTKEGYSNVMLVDGYSTDGTRGVGQEYGVQIVQQHSRGKTGAIQTAIDYVKTPYLLIMDGDFTYAASDIRRLLTHGKKYDEVIGVRSNGSQKIVRSHRFGNKIITGVFNLLMGAKLSDVLSGMYLLKTESARSLRLETTGFGVEVEIASQMSQHGTITEVPIIYRSRIGKQKLSTWKDGPKILSTVLRLARKYNPTFLFSLCAALTAVPGIAIISWVLADQAITGSFMIEWGFAGAVLVLISIQALAVSAISLIIKRSESRITARLSALLNQS